MHKTYHNYNTMLFHIDSAQSNLGKQFEVLVDVDYRIIRKFTETDEPETNIFFFHKDHLGSSTQISDINQSIVHHIEYMPTGELFAEQRDYWHTPYRFNGKELDAETGLYYYGARYYTPELGVWLSVDPLSDKYPSISSFAYCLNNPVKLIDPNGMEVELGDIMINVENDTKYINKKGEILYETKDGLNDIIIVSDNNLKIFEDKLNELNNKGKVNNAKANKEELHSLGVEILDYKDNHKIGTEAYDIGFITGYEVGYSGEKSTLKDLWFGFGVNLFMDIPDGGYISGGYREGKNQGKKDNNQGNINMLKPFEGIKNNLPLIKLQTPQQKQSNTKHKHI
ncbi:MAG: RHS repeat-associated core domain-containing protein [Bacteroidales bacterium]